MSATINEVDHASIKALGRKPEQIEGELIGRRVGKKEWVPVERKGDAFSVCLSL